MALSVFWGKHYRFYGDSTLDAIIFHSDLSDLADNTLNELRVLGSNFANGAYDTCADSVICSRGLLSNTCCIA